MRELGTLDARRPASLAASPADELRLALAQVAPASENAEAHALRTAEQLAEAAARRGADILVLPEYYFTGAEHDLWRRVAEQGTPSGTSDDPLDDPEHFLHEIARLAQAHDIDIVAGTAVEAGHHQPQHRTSSHKKADEDEAETKLFNTCYYVGRDGEVKGRYTKRNLWHPERAVLSAATAASHPHDRTFVVTTRRGREVRVGMLICWDLGFPEAFRELLERPSGGEETMVGPDVVFVPTCWYATDAGARGIAWNKESEAALLDSICVARAIENECIVAMCNVAGPSWPADAVTDASEEPEAVGVGRTSVSAPFLGSVARVEDEHEALLFAAVDLRVLPDASAVYRCRADLFESSSTE